MLFADEQKGGQPDGRTDTPSWLTTKQGVWQSSSRAINRHPIFFDFARNFVYILVLVVVSLPSWLLLVAVLTSSDSPGMGDIHRGLGSRLSKFKKLPAMNL